MIAWGMLAIVRTRGPRFVATDEARAVVRLFAGCGMPRDRLCLLVNRHGRPIMVKTLEKHFAHELSVARSELDEIVFTKLMAAAKRGEQWAIRYISMRSHVRAMGWVDQQNLAIGGAPANPDLPPFNLVVQFEKPDPAKKPKPVGLDGADRVERFTPTPVEHYFSHQVNPEVPKEAGGPKAFHCDPDPAPETAGRTGNIAAYGRT